MQQDSKWQYLLTTISCQEQGSFEALLGWHHLAISYPMKKVKPIPNHIYPKYIPKHIPYISPKYPCKLPPPPSGPHFVGLKWSRWGIPIYKMKSYNPSYNPGCLQNVSLQQNPAKRGFHPNSPNLSHISPEYIYIYIIIYIFIFIPYIYISLK